LKPYEPILFYDEIPLYEDELDDNGASKMGVKIVSQKSTYEEKEIYVLSTASESHV
jgi:hypothetical protein